MKRMMAVLLAVLLVMSMGTVALAAANSPVAPPTVGGLDGSTGGGDVSTSVEMQADIREAVAAVGGISTDAMVTHAAAKMDVAASDGETFPVALNMPASLNGQTVQIAVLQADGTYKIIEAVVVDGKVVFDAPVVGGSVTFMVYTVK